MYLSDKVRFLAEVFASRNRPWASSKSSLEITVLPLIEARIFAGVKS
jgi:hypothetical protein